MKALFSETQNGRMITELTERPEPTPKDGEVKIKIQYSSINYKDALAVTGAGRIFKKLPIVGGIDSAGDIVESKSKKFKVGDTVLINGCGLGETHDGGYEEFVVEADKNVVPRVRSFSARQAMTFGTAGFTATLALERMLQNGQTAAMGPILVTGASGGVGQFAIRAFSRAGFEVHALTGKKEMHERLTKLGAKKILLPNEFLPGGTSAPPIAPLETVQYGGAVDNLGGRTLAAIMARAQLWGNVACIGLAEGAELDATVMPMILRGVSLIGISSNNCPYDLRCKIWQKLSDQTGDLDEFVSREVTLEQVVDVAKQMLSRQTHGRFVVKI